MQRSIALKSELKHKPPPTFQTNPIMCMLGDPNSIKRALKIIRTAAYRKRERTWGLNPTELINC